MIKCCVVVIGFGMFLLLGFNSEDIWCKLFVGESGIGEIIYFDCSNYLICFVG